MLQFTLPSSLRGNTLPSSLTGKTTGYPTQGTFNMWFQTLQDSTKSPKKSRSD